MVELCYPSGTERFRSHLRLFDYYLRFIIIFFAGFIERFLSEEEEKGGKRGGWGGGSREELTQ